MKIDHIVCIVPNLQGAISWINRALGCTPVLGGKHENLGTHNAILGLKSNIGEQIYLEFLAIDPEAKKMKSYPLGLSEDLSRPIITAWAVRVENIDKTAEQMNLLGKSYSPGTVTQLSRTRLDGSKLEWRIAYSKEQTEASGGVIPFLIDWGSSKHPADNLTEYEQCHCHKFLIMHPDSKVINNNLLKLGLEGIQVEGGNVPGFKLLLSRENKQLTIYDKHII